MNGKSVERSNDGGMKPQILNFKPLSGGDARPGEHALEDGGAGVREGGIAVYNTYRTCPVQTFGHAGTKLGRAADVTFFPPSDQ